MGYLDTRPSGAQTPALGHSVPDHRSSRETTSTNADPGSIDRGTKNNFLDQTLRVWQPRSPEQLTRDDARQIADNIAGFFSVLAEWAAAEDGDTGSEHSLAVPARKKDLA